MRIALAKLLLQEPNLLLLDEPTNHLDLEARNWLEEYLTHYPNAFVLISHDRYFLDVTVNKIAEIWNKRIHLYPGNYEKYLASKTQRLEQLEAAYRNQRERIEQLEVFINQAGTEPHQGIGKDRAHRAAGGRKGDPLFLPAAEAERQDRGRVQWRGEILWR
jgi:ATPase subunit of ABC transporter with duplicated ATPase domains